ncbi:MAG: ammonium transporter [Planctomycetaceae bacterium]|nr:ammonium transporter [Planctomycetaceae bacterium]
MNFPRLLPAFANVPYLLLGPLVLVAAFLFAASSVQAMQPETPPPADTSAVAEEIAAEEAPAEEEAGAEEEVPDTLATLRGETDILWTCLAAFLVFFMQAGFALVEAGMTRSKNVVNIIMKNLMDFGIGSITFWAVGFGLMFGANPSKWIGTTDFFVDGMVDGAVDSWEFAFLIFQTVFAATAATIVSGAMAERTKFSAYLIYSIAITAIVYPISGSWAWGSLYNGGGWLEDMGFMDFAGSTVVHSVGGWCALAGAIVIGARKGKYTSDGQIVPIMGHSVPLAALGVFILWLGWFGFNPGSTTAVGGGELARVAVTTNLSAVGGCVSAMLLSWILFGKPDVSFALNGALAGLVSITAPCYNVGPLPALIIGLIGGVVCVFSVLFFDKIRIDDPVGAISVHGVCGAWGTIACGLFAQDIYGGGGDGLFYGGGAGQLITQLIGIGAFFAWAFGTSLIIFLLIKVTIGLRVSEEEELRGLDICEHGMAAYPYLQSLESA